MTRTTLAAAAALVGALVSSLSAHAVLLGGSGSGSAAGGLGPIGAGLTGQGRLDGAATRPSARDAIRRSEDKARGAGATASERAAAARDRAGATGDAAAQRAAVVHDRAAGAASRLPEPSAGGGGAAGASLGARELGAGGNANGNAGAAGRGATVDSGASASARR